MGGFSTVDTNSIDELISGENPLTAICTNSGVYFPD